MIGVANRPSNYADAHEHLLITYAAQVAIAIRNAQLNAALAAAKQDLEAKVAARTAELARAQQALAHKAEQLQQLLNETVKVQERERQRISQDLHDGLNQLLVGALLELRTGRERLWLGDRAEADSAFERAGGILHRVEAEMREVIHDLRPPALDAVGLVPTLRSTVERFAAQTGLACQVTVEGAPARLADEVEISLYRILQEALTNIHLHAQARQVEVSVHFDPQWVALYVRDDGCGFVARTTIADDHYGLLGMRERAESIGGALSIESRIGLGTQVRILVPG
jgi:signal transduction histidine kinase